MDERTAFESYMTEGGTWPKAVVRGRDGQYLLAQTAAAWTVWQARAAQPAAPTVVEPARRVQKQFMDEEVFYATPPRAALTVDEAISALVAALAESKGWLRDYSDAVIRDAIDRREPRAALTDAQLLDILQSLDACTARLPGGFRLFARAVEQAHGIGGPQ